MATVKKGETTTVKIFKPSHAKLKLHVLLHGVDMTVFVSQAVEEKIKRTKKKVI